MSMDYEKEFRRLYDEGYSRPEIAEYFGFDVNWVTNMRVKLHLPPMGKVRSRRDREFVKLYNKGYSKRELADHFNLSLDRVQKIRARLDLPAFPINTKGSPRIDRKEFKRLFDAGYDANKMAEHFNSRPEWMREVRRQLNLPPFPKYVPKNKKIDRDKARELWQAGKDNEYVANYFGVKKGYLQGVKHDMGLTDTRFSHTKIVDVEVIRRVEEMLDDRASYAEISRTLPVSEWWVSKHYPGRGWTPLECGRFAALMHYSESHGREYLYANGGKS